MGSNCCTILLLRPPKWKIGKMTHLHFWPLFHLGPLATVCDGPFSQEKVHSAIFRVFWYFKGWHPLNEKSERWPTWIFGRSFIWDHLQRCAMNRFLRKRYTLLFFRVFNIFKGYRPPKWKIGKMTHLHFWPIFHLGPLATVCDEPFSQEKVHSAIF